MNNFQSDEEKHQQTYTSDYVVGASTGSTVTSWYGTK